MNKDNNLESENKELEQQRAELSETNIGAVQDDTAGVGGDLSENKEVFGKTETAEVLEKTEMDEAVEKTETAEVLEKTETAEVLEKAETAEVLEKAETDEAAEKTEVLEKTEADEPRSSDNEGDAPQAEVTPESATGSQNVPASADEDVAQTYLKVIGNDRNESEYNSDKPKLRSVWLKVGALVLAFVMAFGGAFAGVAYVCETALLGDSEFFAAFMAKYAGITENKVEVDYITGEYTGDTIALSDKVKRTSVVIRVVQYNADVYEYTETTSGSGVILEQYEDGTAIIITNEHVVAGATKFYVETYSGNRYDGTIMHMDEIGDLAIVKIKADEKLECATVADSDKAMSGQQVIIAGNPLGTGMATSLGYVAANDRDIGAFGGSYIQLDISANPGNSGGGLYDVYGNLLGIVTSKARGTNVDGIAYAIPSNRVLSSINDLLKFGYVKGRPALGITVVTVNESNWSYHKTGELRNYLHENNSLYYGVYVISSKYSNDVKMGDRIVSINGREVNINDDVLSVIYDLSPGSIAKLVLERASVDENGTVTYSTINANILLRERDWADEIPK